jgi:predicted nucleotidyltransferase
MVMFNVTNMLSKEDTLLERIFGSTRQWHFEELRRDVKIGKPQLARWLKKFEQDGIVKRIKQKSAMPYYVQNNEDVRFRNRKKLFAWKKMLDCGLIDHLASLPDVKVVILFGSLSRWDWYNHSDIDIFIYGEGELEKGIFESRLNREIEVHQAKNSADLQRISRLLPSIISGNLIKGSIRDLGVEIRAKV